MKSNIKIIDPHLHLFDLKQGIYTWLQAENPPFWPDKASINRNFSELDLQLTKPLELSGFVHIEAGFDNQHPWREIAWLEANCSLPFKAIAGCDLTLASAQFKEQINRCHQFQSVVGFRHILDDQATVLLSSTQVQQNLAYLAKLNLIFECQFEIHNQVAVSLLIQILESTPNLTLVINHAGLPQQENKTEFNLWLAALAKLSQYPNCAIKCSGLEMLKRDYSLSWQHQISQALLFFFGSKRVMLASNFPLILWHASYQKYWSTSIHLLSESPQVQRQLCYENALFWYGFNKI